jgi:hypothetical protein
MSSEEAARHIQTNAKNAEVLQPYMGGEDLAKRWDLSAPRWVINFGDRSLCEVEEYPDLLEIVRQKVKPERDLVKRQAHRDKWWQFAESRPGMQRALSTLTRAIVLARVSKAVAPVFGPTSVAFSGQVVVFPYDDYAHFAVLASNVHWLWASAQASTLETRLRYSPSDCFETFPLPALTGELTKAGEAFDAARDSVMKATRVGITKVYNRLSDVGDNGQDIQAIRAAMARVDAAVLAAYGWGDLNPTHGTRVTPFGPRYLLDTATSTELLARLRQLNHQKTKRG